MDIIDVRSTLDLLSSVIFKWGNNKLTLVGITRDILIDISLDIINDDIQGIYSISKDNLVNLLGVYKDSKGMVDITLDNGVLTFNSNNLVYKISVQRVRDINLLDEISEVKLVSFNGNKFKDILKNMCNIGDIVVDKNCLYASDNISYCVHKVDLSIDKSYIVGQGVIKSILKVMGDTYIVDWYINDELDVCILYWDNIRVVYRMCSTSESSNLGSLIDSLDFIGEYRGIKCKDLLNGINTSGSVVCLELSNDNVSIVGDTYSINLGCIGGKDIDIKVGVSSLRKILKGRLGRDIVLKVYSKGVYKVLCIGYRYGYNLDSYIVCT